jgi:hypothetical protein
MKLGIQAKSWRMWGVHDIPLSKSYNFLLETFPNVMNTSATPRRNYVLLEPSLIYRVQALPSRHRGIFRFMARKHGDDSDVISKLLKGSEQ